MQGFPCCLGVVSSIHRPLSRCSRLRPACPACAPPDLAAQGTVYWAAQGQGAYVQRSQQEPRQLQCAEVDLAAPGLVVVASASHLTPETEQFVSGLAQPTFKQLGSSLKLLMVGG